MNSIAWKSFTLMALTAIVAVPGRAAAQLPREEQPNQSRYVVKELGTLGGTVSVGESINNRGWITGAANLAGDTTQHATLWRNGRITDLGTLGGPSSRVVSGVHNTNGEVAGGSETSIPDPLGESVCSTFQPGFSGQPLICLGFVWRNNVMTPLPTLGGNNGLAIGGVNDRGQITGFAENGTQDPECPPPQLLDFEAVIWGPGDGQIQQLPPLAGDTVAIATETNDGGQSVGASALCSAFATGIVHAVMWQTGSITDLGNLGSQLFNFAFAVNEAGQVVGESGVPGDITWHAFLWQNGVMKDLGTLPGDFMSVANAINNKGQVVGTSCTDQFFNNCRAFLWQNGVMTDLNTLIPLNSSVSLVIANDITDHGEIVGFAVDPSAGESPGFLAIPCDEQHTEMEACAESTSVTTPANSPNLSVTLPENARERLLKRMPFGHSIGSKQKQ